MPFDPFFSSKVPNPEEEIHRRTAYAKAYALREKMDKMSKKCRETIIKRISISKEDKRTRCCASVFKHSLMPASGPGHPSLTGFKPAKKKWTEASRLKRPPVKQETKARTRDCAYEYALRHLELEQLTKKAPKNECRSSVP